MVLGQFLPESTLVYLVVIAATTGMIWFGSGWLEGAAEQLSRYYGLPAVVQGSIVVAVGSSFPELSATVISTLVHGQFDLGVAAIVGSALFNVLMVPALSSLWSEDALASNRDLVYKEAQFYLISIAVLLLVFSFAVIYNPVEGDRKSVV